MLNNNINLIYKFIIFEHNSTIETKIAKKPQILYFDFQNCHKLKNISHNINFPN